MYSVNKIFVNENILVAALGHDGVLVYEIHSDGLLTIKGKLSTSYANSVKIHKNIIFIATEDGVEIFEIE